MPSDVLEVPVPGTLGCRVRIFQTATGPLETPVPLAFAIVPADLPTWCTSGHSAVQGPATVVRDALPWLRAAMLLEGNREDDRLVHAYVQSRAAPAASKPLTRKAELG